MNFKIENEQICHGRNINDSLNWIMNQLRINESKVLGNRSKLSSKTMVRMIATTKYALKSFGITCEL
jgi:hypothetical protein